MRSPRFAGKLQRVKLSELIVDEEYQRSASKAMVKKIAAGLKVNPNEYSPPKIMIRRGKCFIVDGQHMVLAAAEVDWDDIYCLVFESDGVAHEAANFGKWNDTRNPTSLAKLKAQLKEKGSVGTHAREMNRIVESCGFSFSFSMNTHKYGLITSVRTIRDAYEQKVLSNVLLVIASAWGDWPDGKDKRMAVQSIIISGLTGFLVERNGKPVDLDLLSSKLRAYSPLILRGQCETVQVSGGGRGAAMAKVIGKIYRSKGKVAK